MGFSISLLLVSFLTLIFNFATCGSECYEAIWFAFLLPFGLSIPFCFGPVPRAQIFTIYFFTIYFFWGLFSLPRKPPQIHPKSKKIEKKSFQKKALKKRAPRPSLYQRTFTASQAFWDPRRASNYHSND